MENEFLSRRIKDVNLNLEEGSPFLGKESEKLFLDVLRTNKEIKNLHRKLTLLKEKLNKGQDVSKQVRELSEETLNLRGSINYDALLSDSEDEINNLFDAFALLTVINEELLLGILNSEDEIKASEAVGEKDNQEIFDKITFFGEDIDQTKVLDYVDFFKRNGFPEREQGELISNYLAKVYTAVLNRGIIYLWNKRLDTAGSTPRTKDYEEEPMYGPSTRAELLSSELIYMKNQETEVYSFESFFDQFPHIFQNSEEVSVVKEFCNRWKNLFAEIEVLHNRAVVRREGNNPSGPGYDKAGPEGALKGLENLQKEESLNLKRIFPSAQEKENLPVQEKEFLEACQFTMGLWSLMHLKEEERDRVWDQVDDDMKQFFDVKLSDKRRKITIKTNYASVLPIVNGQKSKQINMIKKLLVVISERKLENIPDSQKPALAMLAYHVGESFRIGAGFDTFFDVSYDKKTGKVKTAAQDGETKLATLGGYVESNNSKKYRTQYIDVFGEKLFHMYLPVARLMQYNHSFPSQLTFVPDGRASLVHLLAVKDGVHTIDWSTGVSAPDRKVAELAGEADLGFWKIASMKNAKANADKLLWDPVDDFKATPLNFIKEARFAMALDPEYEKGIRRRDVINKVFGGNRYVTVDEAARIAFKDEDDAELSYDDEERLKDKILKHGVDYYMGRMRNEYNGDVARTLRFLFTRDDKPQHEFFVNERVESLFRTFIDFTKNKNPTTSLKHESDNLVKRMAAYYLFDVNMSVCAWLVKPDFSSIEGGASYQKIDWETAFNNLNMESLSEMRVRTPCEKVMHISEIDALINKLINIRDSDGLRKVVEDYKDAGYELMKDSNEQDFLRESSDIRIPYLKNKNIPFSRFDLLAFLQREANLALGYIYQHGQIGDRGHQGYYLVRKDDKKVGPQDFINKQLLIEELTRKK